MSFGNSRDPSSAGRPSPYSCPVCQDRRYSTFPQGEYAAAARCGACGDQCDECDGSGYIFENPRRGYRFVRACGTCSNLDNRIDCFNKARIPAHYAQASFESFISYENGGSVGNLHTIREHLWTRAQSFYPGEQGVVITGDVGTGKTHLLVALVRHFTLEKGIRTRMIEFSHLLSMLREAYERRSNSVDLLNNLSTVPVLAIDELGKGRNNDWQISIIDELISKRYNANLAIFGTSNYALTKPPVQPSTQAMVDTSSADFQKTLEQSYLMARIGERIVSRLCEITKVLEVEGVEDFRRRRASAAGSRMTPNIPKPSTFPFRDPKKGFKY